MKTLELKETNCAYCGTLFSIEESLLDIRKQDGRSFFCPNGHELKFTNSPASKMEKLTEELEETKEELRNAQTEITRLKCELVKPKSKVKTFWGGLIK